MTDLLHTLPDFPTRSYTHLIPSLEKNLISTTDLITLDPLEVAKRAQLPLLDVKRLSKHVLISLQNQFGVIDNADEELRKYGDEQKLKEAGKLSKSGREIVSQWSQITTLDVTFDSALGGGIPTGYITEFSGESGAGKTQLLLVLLLSAQLPLSHGGLSRPTVYISTEHPLPTTRLTQLLQTNLLFSSLPSYQKPSLSQIFTLQIPDLESQDHILTFQLPVLCARHKPALIVIDSIAANYRAERSSSATAGAALGLRSAQLVQLGQQLRALAREHDCAVVVANQVADRFAPMSPPRQAPSTPPHSNRAAASSSSEVSASIEAVIMPPPPLSSSPIPSHQPSLLTSHILTLDHQQDFFTGWSAGPPHQSHGPAVQPQPTNLKTPSLGLVWANQIACRIALVKEMTYGPPISLASASSTKLEDGQVERIRGEWTPRHWSRWMKVVFAPWAPGIGADERGVKFEIWEGGVRAVDL